MTYGTEEKNNKKSKQKKHKHRKKKKNKQTKRQPMEWEKVVSNDAANKNIITKIYKQHIKLNNKKAGVPTVAQWKQSNSEP